MTDVHEGNEVVVETPKDTGHQRNTRFGILAAVILAILAIGIGWLVFGDSDDETPIEDAVVSSTIDSTDEALVGADVGFPLGRFENRDSGLRIIWLNEDGTYSFNKTGAYVATGKFAVDGDVLTLLGEGIDPQADSGTYNWRYEDDTLKFTVIEDAHRGRYAFITYPFVRAE